MQLEKDPCSPTPSQKAALEKYLDLLRDSQEELGELSQQCQNELRVARQAACTIYSTIGARAFILFAFTVNINTISKRKTTNPLIPAFRGWWQNRKTPDSLKTITEELCQEHAIEELVCDCSGAAKPPGRRGRSRTIGTHKRKTRGKKRGSMRIMATGILVVLTQRQDTGTTGFHLRGLAKIQKMNHPGKSHAVKAPIQ